MRGFVDLHCHWIAEIDDGARSIAEGLEMLVELRGAGFDRVVATPHMRPGMFDNDRVALERAYARMLPHVRASANLPDVALASEHYFDEVVFQRLMQGQGLPYPGVSGARAVLLEFYEMDFPQTLDHRLFELKTRGLLPIIAHPERYRAVWRSTANFERLIDNGAAALLDIAALAGKYGAKPQRCAEELLEQGLYHAACSDAHRPADVAAVLTGMRLVQARYGDEELEFLLREGPLALLDGNVPE